METVLNYIKNNFSNYLEELKDYLKIKSISTLDEHKDDMQNCAKFVASKFESAGLENIKIFQTEKHPIVYADWLHQPNKPTILIYGHYDVQPVDPIELWKSNPFEPVIINKKIYARGANDNKGQNFVHIKSVEAFMKTKGTLPVNVKFLFEGEEEVGSTSLTKFIIENKKLLKCDALLISDTSMFAPNTPTITYGLRGLLYMEIEVTAANRDLHSGSFGGAVANPINELAKIISKLHDKNGKVTIPNFYKDVLPISKEEKENFKKLKFSDKNFAKELNVKELYGEKGFSTLERLWVRPTLDCNGIIGGFTEKGAKTVLPAKATAKISMRLVPNQDPKKLAKDFENYVKSISPNWVKVEVKMLHYGYPAMTSIDDPTIKAASNALKKAFKKDPVFTREGGSIPIIVDFMKQLKAPAILMGFGLDTDDIHSPNEHFRLENFEKGLLSSAYFINEMANI
ncbi:dipeptidase [Stygiobacter electus]|uniref:Dipeptidase n=1 Tax=Stygiobacter electus TaxID=3032292 RepID=A0AAE3NVQ5_9BACT|nr:dipeptidase [Stygiobacter electus]MDF1610941.1 dipeptidase [Stygiobacter electus]